MDLSIAIVSYNCRELLGRCLTALRANPPSGRYEVVVVDNASGDGTVSFVQASFPEVRLIPSRENLGFAAGTNLGLRDSDARVLLMLNPDTEVRPGALDALLGFLHEHPAVGAVGPRLVSPAGDLELSCHSLPGLGTTLMGQLGLARTFPHCRLCGRYDMTWWDHAAPRRVDWVSGAALACTREAWETVGPLDEDYFLYFEDVDWCYRLARAGLHCWYLPSAVIVHHEAGSWTGASRRRVLTAHRSAFRYFRKHRNRAVEVLVRLMVGAGALARAVLWSVARPLAARRGRVVADPGIHWAVAREALLGGEARAAETTSPAPGPSEPRGDEGESGETAATAPRNGQDG